MLMTGMVCQLKLSQEEIVLVFDVESWLHMVRCRNENQEANGGLRVHGAMALVGYSVQIQCAVGSLNAKLPGNE